MVRKKCHMASLDLADACYSVPVAAVNQKYLFPFESALYKFLCLPNGLTSATGIFTKLLKPLFSHLRKLEHETMEYLDDSFICGDSV